MRYNMNNPPFWHHKTVLLTGASSGIGLALLNQLSTSGATVIYVSRHSLKGTLTENPKLIEFIADLNIATDLERLEAFVSAQCGHIDVLINNAGIEQICPFLDIPEEELFSVYQVNLFASITLCRKFIPGMVTAGWGCVVNVCSFVPYLPAPLMASYAGSKAGLIAFSNALRHELYVKGIKVLTVIPGSIRTPMLQRFIEHQSELASFTVNISPKGSASVLAAKIIKGIEHNRSHMVYPAFYVLFCWYGIVMTKCATLIGRLPPFFSRLNRDLQQKWR